MSRPKKTDDSIVLKFGGGVHSRASEDEIDLRECTLGENFILDLQSREMRPREGFELVGTAPNAGQINGFISLLKTDGSVHLAVQAGDTVYGVDSAYAFTSIGTVASTARLRGRLEANWELDDKVLITDISLTEEIYDWDGTTFQKTVFTKNDGSTGWTGDFRAKYCFVEDERAWYACIYDGSAEFGHLIVGSDREDYTILSNDLKPSSAIGDADAFFMVQPDLHKINGLVQSWNKIVTSSQSGSLYRVNGSTSKDFAMVSMFPRSGAKGDEALVYAGNDVIYGRQGRIESVAATDQFGDVETNDLSEDISDLIDGFNDWTLVYNQRLQRVYCFPTGGDYIWVLHKSIIGTGLSPWVKYTTSHVTGFQPTAVMNALDPSDGLEYVYFGDASGNVYKLEGGTSDDSNNIVTTRTSGLFKVPEDLESFELSGWVLHRGIVDSVDIVMEFQFQGENVFNESVTVTLDGTNGGWFWGEGSYWGGELYWGTPIKGKLSRKKFGVPGQSNEFQIKTTIEETVDFRIAEIGLTFSAAN
jgi:hypothetical protein